MLMEKHFFNIKKKKNINFDNLYLNLNIGNEYYNKNYDIKSIKTYINQVPKILNS